MDLGLCVDEVQLVDEFALTGRRVVLIDIPGFGDTTKSDTDAEDDRRLLGHDVSADDATIPVCGRRSKL